MPRVDFAFGCRDRLRTACLIARKRQQAGERLVVYCGDAQRLSAFDRLLWTFDSSAFVPHVYADDPLAAHTPIVLTVQAPLAARNTMGEGASVALLNLDDDCPPEASAFAHVMEVVADQDADKHAARQRWRAYQAQDCELHAHDLAARRAAA